jgi:hypothetical protein
MREDNKTFNVSGDVYKLRIARSGNGEIEIVGNRAGLKELATVCRALSELSDREATTPANHYHLADYMNNAEPGSLELIIRYDPHL